MSEADIITTLRDWYEFARVQGGIIVPYLWWSKADLSGGPTAGTPKSHVRSNRIESTNYFRMESTWGVPRIMGIISEAEAGTLDGGYLDFLESDEKLFYGNKSQRAAGLVVINDLLKESGGYAIAPGSAMRNMLGITTAAAQQSFSIVHVFYPSPPEQERAFGVNRESLPWGPTIRGKKTGTIVADVINDFGTLLESFEDSMKNLPADRQYVIDAIINGPGLAGISLYGLLSPDGRHEVFIPGSMASVNEYTWLVPRWPHVATNPVHGLVIGDVTTTSEMTLEISASKSMF